MSRSEEVPAKFREKRGLCVECGTALVEQGNWNNFENGYLCRLHKEHPGLCCGCFDRSANA